MSWVANVMLSVDLDDEHLVPSLNEWLQNDAPRRYEVGGQRPTGGVGSLSCITGPDTQWGGHKYPECSVWARRAQSR